MKANHKLDVVEIPTDSEILGIREVASTKNYAGGVLSPIGKCWLQDSNAGDSSYCRTTAEVSGIVGQMSFEMGEINS